MTSLINNFSEHIERCINEFKEVYEKKIKKKNKKITRTLKKKLAKRDPNCTNIFYKMRKHNGELYRFPSEEKSLSRKSRKSRKTRRINNSNSHRYSKSKRKRTSKARGNVINGF